jgi:hypothetical protein
MTVTNDFQVFLNGCIKNNAVDYKILYENKCKENEELKKQADAENTANMIDRLNQEYDELDDRHNLYVKEKQEYIDSLLSDRASYYHLCQTLIVSLICHNSEHNPGEDIPIGETVNYNLGDDGFVYLKDIINDMNNDDWNGDGQITQMVLTDDNEITFHYNDTDEEEDSDDE